MTFETVFLHEGIWYDILDNASYSNRLGVVTDTQNQVRVTSASDAKEVHEQWRFFFDGERLRIANRATDDQGLYLEGADVDGIALMSGPPDGGGFFSGQGWRVEAIGDNDHNVGISAPMRIYPFASDGTSDLIQRDDGWAGLGAQGVVALKCWRLRRIGPRLPVPENPCGWLAADSFYGCGGTGDDPSGNLARACPAGLGVGEACGTTGLVGEGCCAADGHNWYCTDMRVAFQAICQ